MINNQDQVPILVLLALAVVVLICAGCTKPKPNAFGMTPNELQEWKDGAKEWLAEFNADMDQMETVRKI